MTRDKIHSSVPATTGDRGAAARGGPSTPIRVFGNTVDAQTRCVHYNTAKDIVAIKFFCCARYYPCFQCHQEAESHPARQWPASRNSEKAILCGVCQSELTIAEYRSTSVCTKCSAPFNERCANHAHYYFEAPGGGVK